MNACTTAPLGAAQYWVTPFWFCGPVQWVRATCLPLGNDLPSLDYHGAAMNLSLSGSNLLEIALTSW